MRPPSQKEVEQVVLAVIDRRMSREQADAWACKWVTADEPPDMDPAIWTALMRLCGCDMRHGYPAGDYLHTREQFAEWLEDLRRDAATYHRFAD